MGSARSPLACQPILVTPADITQNRTQTAMNSTLASKKYFCLALVLGCAFSLLAAAGLCAQATHPSYDVVIAGAGTGGTSAAITAARMGARVALIEETDWLGGQAAAAAVSTMDEGNNLTPPSGMYREFVDRMAAYYQARRKSVSTCYWGTNSHCYEPAAIRKILQQMIDEVNAGAYGKGHIDLYLRDHVARVLKNASAVTGVVTAKGITLNSQVLIDATEYGDVLPLTGAHYRSGRAIDADKANTCTQDITYTLVIKRYPKGVPAELLLQHEPPEYQTYLPKLRGQWRIDGNPVNRWLPVNFAMHNAYRGLPDSSNPVSYTSQQPTQITRTVLNWFNDYPAHTEIFNRSERMKILCEAKLKTLANLYYLQHELKMNDWSVANDEGYNTAFNREENSCPNIPAEFKAIEQHFPVMPYIRESQRLVGVYTLTGGDVRREQQGGVSVTGFQDSIAVGDYADDLHNCASAGDYEFDLEHLSDRAPGFRSGPFEIPLRALIPETVDGLLAAEKNISQSRMANGATRLQPITMLTGEAAGALAALAAERKTQPRNVSPEAVQIALLERGAILARAPMHDMILGVIPWQAAQFAVAHQWMATDNGLFRPNLPMTRADVAELLDRAFVLSASPFDPSKIYRPSSYEAASFADVPLFNPHATAVEAWRATGTLPACRSNAQQFCASDSISVGDFTRAVAALAARNQNNKAQLSSVLLENLDVNEDAPLNRIQAAMILWNNARSAQ